MTKSSNYWGELIEAEKPSKHLQTALWFVAQTLSNMTKQQFTTPKLQIGQKTAKQLRSSASKYDQLVGVYLMLSDILPGQTILLLEPKAALNIVDVLQEQAVGTSTTIGELERSALAELGNIAISAFLNMANQPTWGALHPSPPIVLVDTPEIILDTLVTSCIGYDDSLQLIEANYQDTDNLHPITLWIVPETTQVQTESRIPS
jgi:chemotaxis protein CheY-P-specific phosphatase CheC